MRKKQSLSLFLSILFVAISLVAPAYAADGAEPAETGHAVIFVLDASNSMNSNDRDRLAIDSIAQLIYSLPSDFEVGFAAYNTEVTAETALVDSGHRGTVMAAAETVRYIGYTNAGAGLSLALEQLKATQAVDKSVVILSDGEIVMQNDQKTAESSNLFQTAVAAAQKNGVKIHVIGLGEDMEDRENTIFSASSTTGGASLHAPKAADIQTAVDTLLLEQFQVRKTTAAIVNVSGQEERLSVDLPGSHASKVRVLLTSASPIQNLKADFTAYSGEQVGGTHYALIEMTRPTSERINLSFHGEAGSQVKVDVITEYCVSAQAETTYSDALPEDPETLTYQREASVQIAFCNRDNPNQQIFTDTVFDRLPVPLTINGETVDGVLQDGLIHFDRSVSAEETLTISYDLSALPVNILSADPVRLTLDAPPFLPVKDWTPYYIVGGGLLSLVILAIVVLVVTQRRRKPQAIPEAPPPPASKYSYSGRLSIYITKTPSGYDIPPLTYNLFRLSPSRVLSLQEILDECNVDERFEGAGQLYFKSGANRCLVLTNNSDCTVMQNREILMKNRSYQISLDSKLDITFEDEVSELVLQYRDVKPSEMRVAAGVR